MTGFLRRAALRLGRVRAFRSLFRLYYAAGLFACALGACLSRSCAALLAHRGWTRGDWEPAVSDLDLFVIVRGGRLPYRWARLYRLLKGLFPMLGEWLCADGPELGFYLRHGDLRSAELSASAQVLCGRADIARRYRPQSAKLAVDAWNECYHAHARLCGIYFSGRRGPAERYGARKSLLDMARYGACMGAGPEVLPSGRASAAGSGSIPQELAVPLEGLSGFGALEEDCALSAVFCSARYLERLAGTVLSCAERGPAAAQVQLIPACAHEQSANGKFGAELSAALGPGWLGGVTDTLFESYFVFSLESVADRERLAAFRAIARAHPALNGSKIALGSDSMRLLSAGLKPEDRAFAAVHECGQAFVSGLPEFWARHRRAYFLRAREDGWQLSLAHDQELRRAAFARFLVSWRFDALQGASGEEYGVRLFYHWLPRAAHFYLFYAHGRELSCFPALPLLKKLAEVRPCQQLERVLSAGVEPAPGECAALVQALGAEALACVK